MINLTYSRKNDIRLIIVNGQLLKLEIYKKKNYLHYYLEYFMYY